MRYVYVQVYMRQLADGSWFRMEAVHYPGKPRA
jgi:hypothetical protein